MKFKLFLGFVHCVSMFPTTFSTIPWPRSFVDMSMVLEFFSVDLFAVFGFAECTFATGFYQQFMFSFWLLPATHGLLRSFRTGVLRLRLALPTARHVHNRELAHAALHHPVPRGLLALHGRGDENLPALQVPERPGVWYLAADYRMRCFDAQWYFHAAFAGSPSRCTSSAFPPHLHHSPAEPPLPLRDHVPQRTCCGATPRSSACLGTVYADYTEPNYYFDLVDLGRRLLLTGGLILVGEQSNTQIFLGALLCLCWLVLVLVRRPYQAFWDNVMSGLLSFQLMLIILCGRALEIHKMRADQGSDDDLYERELFGVLLVAFSLLVIAVALCVVVLLIPCVRDRLVRCWARRCGKKDGGGGGGGGGGQGCGSGAEGLPKSTPRRSRMERAPRTRRAPRFSRSHSRSTPTPSGRRARARRDAGSLT